MLNEESIEKYSISVECFFHTEEYRGFRKFWSGSTGKPIGNRIDLLQILQSQNIKILLNVLVLIP